MMSVGQTVAQATEPPSREPSAGQVRLGQVRVFKVHIQSKLSQAQILAFTGSSVWDWGKKEGWGGSKGGRLHWRVQGNTSSPTGIGSRWTVV